MLFSKHPFKVFSRVLKDGIFVIPNDTSAQLPPPELELLLVDNTDDYLINNEGEYLFVKI